MEPEIPDFRDWHESNRQEIRFPGGKSFFELIFYVKCESAERMFEGSCAYFFEKETFKVWVGPDPLSKREQKLIALLLDDGNWVISIPIYAEQDVSKSFHMVRDMNDLSIKISILTKDGWKTRIISIL